MKTLKWISLLIVASLSLFACKKDDVEVVERKITIEGIPGWNSVAGAYSIKLEMDADQNQLLQRAIGDVEVKVLLSANSTSFTSFPHTWVSNNGARITYYHLWSADSGLLTLYMQVTGNVFLINEKPEAVELSLFVLE